MNLFQLKDENLSLHEYIDYLKKKCLKMSYFVKKIKRIQVYAQDME